MDFIIGLAPTALSPVRVQVAQMLVVIIAYIDLNSVLTFLTRPVEGHRGPVPAANGRRQYRRAL